MILELGCASKDEKVVFRLLFLNRVDPKFQLSSEDSYKHFAVGWYASVFYLLNGRFCNQKNMRDF